MLIIQTSQQLGAAVRGARKQLGLTQAQLALAGGARFVVELEAGKPTVRLQHTLRVLAALGGEVQLAGLFSAEGDHAT